MTNILKKTSSDSFKINRRSVSTQLMNRTNMHGHGENYVKQILSNKRRRSIMLLKRTEQLEPHPSNLIPRPLNSFAKRRRSHSSTQMTPKQQNNIQKSYETVYDHLNLSKLNLIQNLKEKKATKTHPGPEETSLNHFHEAKFPAKKLSHPRRGSLAQKISTMTLNNFNERSGVILEPQPYSSAVQLRQTRNINGYIFLVIVRLDAKGLLVRAYPRDNFLKPRIIEVEREDALFFIKTFCENRIQKIYERLQSDDKYLYLMAEEKNHKLKEQNPIYEENDGQEEKIQ